MGFLKKFFEHPTNKHQTVQNPFYASLFYSLTNKMVPLFVLSNRKIRLSDRQSCTGKKRKRKRERKREKKEGEREGERKKTSHSKVASRSRNRVDGTGKKKSRVGCWQNVDPTFCRRMKWQFFFRKGPKNFFKSNSIADSVSRSCFHRIGSHRQVQETESVAVVCTKE